MRFTSLIIKNLTRRPFRSGLTLVALATAIASVVSLLGIARGFQRSFADVYRSHSVDLVVSRQGAADRLSSSISQSLARNINSVVGVQRSAAVLMETLSLEDEGVYGVPTMGMDFDSWMLGDYDFGAIGQIANDQSRQLLLGVHLAERLQLDVGQTIDLFDEPYTVTGIFKSRSTWENGSMILPLWLLQELTGREGQVTYVNVVLGNDVRPEDVSGVIDRIESQDAKLLAMATDDFVATDTRMQIASAMAWMTSMIAVLLGAIGTLNTMMTSVMERTGEIGILRAIGWPKRRVVGMILGESCLLAVLASGLGSLLAVVLTWALSLSPAVRGIMSASIEPIVLVQGMLLGLVIGLLGALAPAWRAARLLPTDAFRDIG